MRNYTSFMLKLMIIIAFICIIFKPLIIILSICIVVYLFMLFKNKNKSKDNSEKEPVTISKPIKKESSTISKPKALYICNDKSNVFHRPSCPCVKNMCEYDLNGDIIKNNSYSDYKTLISIGYKPCNKCKPR